MKRLYTVTQECERCFRRYLPVIEHFDGWMPWQYTEYCQSCTDNRAEAAYEASLSDYYGGEGPVTLSEQSEAARKLK